jgi:putative peptidoglycan lipid II flippase
VAPTLFNVAMIIANFIPKTWQHIEGDALAWGVIAGGALQTGILIPALRKKGYLPKLSWAGWSPQISRIFKNMIPGMLGMGLLQITTLINTNFASELGEGSNSYIYYADRLLELPLSLVSVSLGTALLPTLAKMWSEKEKDKMIATANYYLRLNLFVAIPAALGLFFLGIPIVELLFQRGKFTPENAQVTGAVLQVYAFTLIVSSSVRVLVPSFYAIKNTWYPAVVSGICLVGHILIAPILMARWGLQGLVLSTLLSALGNFILLMSAYPWMIGSFPFGNLLGGIGKFILAGAVLGFICQLYYPLFHSLVGFGFLENLARLLAIGTVIFFAMAGYALVSWILGVTEFKHLKESVRGKLLRKFKRHL